ncbi:hypothetical protein ACIP2X_19335 [Streptomyces sp. NPDC089424]|uniref:hypothetical protein n=1 Tax=Streptomyces sp. NPDC089424 TaxID=3365917 RepID=UPI00382F189B
MGHPLPGWPLPWTGEGAPPAPPEPVVHFLRYADGHIGQIAVTGMDPVIPEGAEVLTQQQYEATRAEINQAHEARLADLQAAEAAARLRQYEELRTVGLSDGTARSLSGYDGPQVEEQAAG